MIIFGVFFRVFLNENEIPNVYAYICSSDVDPHSINADPDPQNFVNADPDPG